LDIWEPNAVILNEHFHPIYEFSSIGSPLYQEGICSTALKNGTEVNHKRFWNMSYNWNALICGYQTIGISNEYLIRVIRCRPEFFNVFPDDYPPLSEEEKQDVKHLERAIQKFSKYHSL
jgi:hypothetical protein